MISPGHTPVILVVCFFISLNIFFHLFSQRSPLETFSNFCLTHYFFDNSDSHSLWAICLFLAASLTKWNSAKGPTVNNHQMVSSDCFFSFGQSASATLKINRKSQLFRQKEIYLVHKWLWHMKTENTE